MRRENFNLREHCVSVALTDDIDVNVFLCGNKEIDDYFHNEALLYGSEMLSRNFVFITEDGMCDVVSMFSLCNYSIDMMSVPGHIKNRLQRKIPNTKRKRSYPALLIGRLGVDRRFRGLGIGSQVIDYIKWLCIHPSNLGICRYLVVDAINTPNVIRFYESNGFTMLFGSEEEEKSSSGISPASVLRTRKMYCDLKLWMREVLGDSVEKV